MVKNPVQGFDTYKEKKYEDDCRPYGRLTKRIVKAELKIVNWPERSRLLHGPLSGKCEGFLHARVDQNMRIIYKPNYEKKIIFLTNFLTHDEMERMCN